MGSGCIAPPFLTSALHEGERSPSRTGHFTPGKRARGNCMGGWVGPRAGLDAGEKTLVRAGNRALAVRSRRYTN
jgi:hypothetical protein